jgi:HK97 family phage prohead protease
MTTIRYGTNSRILEVKASDSGWSVSGYASTWDEDLQGDIVDPHAFDRTLASGRKVRFLLGHDQTQVLGVTKTLKTDTTGLYGEFKISKTSLGTDVHQLLLDGGLDSFSIGFIPIDTERRGDLRVITNLELLEVSVVAVPANPMALVTGVKHRLRAPTLAKLKLEVTRKRLVRKGILAR